MIKKTLFVIAASYTLFACQNEEVLFDLPQEKGAIETPQNNIVSFDSSSDYERIFEDENHLASKTQNMSFISLKSKIEGYDDELTSEAVLSSLDNLEDTIYYDYGLLAEILNEDKIVEIGNHLFKVDLHNKRVLVLDNKYREEYSDLVSDNFSNKNIMIFSTDDDVLELLEEGSLGTTNAVALSCNAPRANRKKDSDKPKRGNRHRLDAKVVYQPAGIYFSILAKGKTQKRRFRVWWRDYSGYCVINYTCIFKLRCGWAFNQRSYQTSVRGVATFRPYQGIRGLEYFLLIGQFRSNSGNTNLLIFDNY